MIARAAKTAIAIGLFFAASQGIAQQNPPPPPPPQQNPPPGQQPPPPPAPPQQNTDDRLPRDQDEERVEDPQRLSWYHGDYVADSISRLMTIDDPVTGFGNEALWFSPEPHADSRQSDIAGSAEPD